MTAARVDTVNRHTLLNAIGENDKNSLARTLGVERRALTSCIAAAAWPVATSSASSAAAPTAPDSPPHTASPRLPHHRRPAAMKWRALAGDRRAFRRSRQESRRPSPASPRSAASPSIRGTSGNSAFCNHSIISIVSTPANTRPVGLHDDFHGRTVRTSCRSRASIATLDPCARARTRQLERR